MDFGGKGALSSESSELWIQALTYYRDMEDKYQCETYLMKALDYIGKMNILSPLLVLEILSTKSNLKFMVLKKFLKLKLEQQTATIKQKKKKVTEIRNEIVENQTQTVQMKTTAINFEQKCCAECNQPLQLPTIHFMCGHVYHEFCID